MIGRLALRSLTAHPVRSAVLAAGFGFGVAVMAILLGVAEVVLEQAQDPALVGGGDVVIRLGRQVPARLLMSGTLQSEGLRSRIDVASPSHTESLFLVREEGPLRVDARGGIPSLERALGDAEILEARVGAGEWTSRPGESDASHGWSDTPADVAWTRETPERTLRHIDRFHAVPADTEWSSSWAEWLYFNGRSNGARFYLTFLVGPPLANGNRPATVRLQLDRDGRVENYGTSAELTQSDVDRAPELTIGRSRVHLDGMVYRLHLELQRDDRGRGEAGSGPGRSGMVVGDLSLVATPGRLVPPVQIAGARGWQTGYVVPVMSGALSGSLAVDGSTTVSFDGGSGYHDHNWGFWQGVSWQWGQVQHGDLSFIYGRVFPPRDAADPDRIPGFVGALGPEGPLGYATNVVISEKDGAEGQPSAITITARGTALDLEIRFDVRSVVATRMSQGPLANGVTFLQMRGDYSVTGQAADRPIRFTAPGAAETFRGN